MQVRWTLVRLKDLIRGTRQVQRRNDLTTQASLAQHKTVYVLDTDHCSGDLQRASWKVRVLAWVLAWIAGKTFPVLLVWQR